MSESSDRAAQVARRIPGGRRMAWTASVLREATRGLQLPADVETLASSAGYVLEARALFHRLRQMTLAAERLHAEPLTVAVLLAAENAAKVLADPRGEEFDPDSVGWFWLCIEDLVDARGDPELQASLASMLEEVSVPS